MLKTSAALIGLQSQQRQYPINYYITENVMSRGKSSHQKQYFLGVVYACLHDYTKKKASI